MFFPMQVYIHSVESVFSPELGSGGSGEGEVNLLEFRLRTPGLLLLSASTVLWWTVGRENGYRRVGIVTERVKN